jgi:hypothetical protein
MRRRSISLPYSVVLRTCAPEKFGLHCSFRLKDPVTGERRGNLDCVFLIEIIYALAARLGVEAQLVGSAT